MQDAGRRCSGPPLLANRESYRIVCSTCETDVVRKWAAKLLATPALLNCLITALPLLPLVTLPERSGRRAKQAEN